MTSGIYLAKMSPMWLLNSQKNNILCQNTTDKLMRGFVDKIFSIIKIFSIFKIFKMVKYIKFVSKHVGFGSGTYLRGS